MRQQITTYIAFFILTHCALGEIGSENTNRIVMPESDRIRISEAFRIGDHIGDRIWEGWSEAPFAVLLVTPEREFLIRHPKPSEDFELIGYDSLLQSDVYFRKRVFDPSLLATFPAVGGIPTIVIGQLENTSIKNSTAWVVTVLHEHFHQLQYSQPGYYASVDALDLSGGDQSGMWMLNYAFPYSLPEVNRKIDGLGRALLAALNSRSDSVFSERVVTYLSERRKLEEMLEPKDYRYFSFQLWQEGVARFAEYSAATFLADGYEPSKRFRSLLDYQSFGRVAEDVKANIEDELETFRLEEYQRVAFYSLGAGEALLLERTNPKWKGLYFTDKFYLENYFTKAR